MSFRGIVVFVLCLLAPVCSLAADPLVRVVELSRSAYFTDTGGTMLSIGPGSYWVDADGDTLNLTGLDGQAEFALTASSESHQEPISEATGLSFAGGSELPDIHFVALLYPDGRQITAQGSYSGIQTRGVLSDAKKKAAQAAAAAAAAKERAARRARQIAAEKAEQARKLAKQAATATGEVVDRVKESVPDPDLTQLIAVANQLGVPDLLSCLEGARGTRHGNISSLANELVADPTAATRAMYVEINQAVNARMGEFEAALEAMGSNPGPAQITDAAFDLLQSIAADKPALKCLMTAVEPRLPQIKRDIVRWQNTMMEEAQKTVHQTIIPGILGDVDERIAEFALGGAGSVQTRGVLDRVGSSSVAIAALRKWEKEGMASGLYMQAMLTEYDAARVSIEGELAKANPDVEEIRAAVSRTKEWITPEQEMRYSIGMLRYRGHRSLEHVDTFIGGKIDGSERLQAFGRRIAIKVVGSICGLVPEVGAGICNAVFVPVEAAAIFAVQKTVKILIKTAMHTGWDLSVQGYEYFVFNHRDPASPGPLYRALRRLSISDVRAAAERDMPEGFRAAFISYSASLEQTMDRWEMERGSGP